MSIQSEINRISGNISDSFAAILGKGGTFPSGGNSDNLADAIMSIPSGGSLPAGIKAISTGVHTLSADVRGKNTFKVTHNLGYVPDVFLIYSLANITTAYSTLSASYNKYVKANGTNPTVVFVARGNSSTAVNLQQSSTDGIGNLTTTTVDVNAYSTTYYFRAGSYRWIAVKLEDDM